MNARSRILEIRTLRGVAAAHRHTNIAMITSSSTSIANTFGGNRGEKLEIQMPEQARVQLVRQVGTVSNSLLTLGSRILSQTEKAASIPRTTDVSALKIKHYPCWSVVASVNLATHPAVYTRIHEPL
jgi:hypothetical protein